MSVQHELSIETSKLVQFSRLCVATNAWKWLVATDSTTNRVTSDEALERSFDDAIPSLAEIRAAYRPLRKDSRIGDLFSDMRNEEFDQLHAILTYAEEHLGAAEAELHTNSSCFITHLLNKGTPDLNLANAEYELSLHILSHYKGSQLVASAV